MSQIQDQIWIGAYSDIMNQTYLNDRKIDYIICCAEEFPYPPGHLITAGKTGQWYKVPIIDNVADSLTDKQFREGAAKLNEWVEAGHRVLVHCFAGMSRSVSVVIAYLILYKRWPFDLAYAHLVLRRPQTNIYPDFFPILKSLK